MADNEKLLEAARMIQEHCKNTKAGEKCCFVAGGICRNGAYCSVGNTYITPSDWVVPKRWTDADVNMAKALASVGYVSVRNTGSLNRVFAEKPSCEGYSIPDGLFANLGKGETVQFSDIIAEGAEQ